MKNNGLRLDFELLKDFLKKQGHEVYGFQFDQQPCDSKYDIAMFMEVIPRTHLKLSERRFWWVNPEWVKDGAAGYAADYFEKIFTKTHEAQRIMEPLFPGKTHYVGFLARDMYAGDVMRSAAFLHIGGNSSLRGTQTVLDAWRWKKNGEGIKAPLTIVSKTIKTEDLPENVVVYHEVDETELQWLQNAHMYHIYPSGTEGFGHALHEAMSVEALIIATNAPPMNEIKHFIPLPVIGQSRFGVADVYEVSSLHVHIAAKMVLDGDASDYGRLARQEFLDGNRAFAENFAPHLENMVWSGTTVVRPPPPKASKKIVAFLGNFEAPESTENMIKWALTERLDMEVIELQENRTSPSDIVGATEFQIDYFLWVRTPGWLRFPDSDMRRILMEMPVPTISLHLDKFVGIPEREKLIGVHPFWKADEVWTADGSNAAATIFEARGVNHHWMRPAVSEVYCHPGTPSGEFRCDVLFCGARDYHPEYPFRSKMIDFLEKTYGNRFRRLTGVRGHRLNDAYASAKVIVGDCFAAGTPRYWSDRLPETCGRYGYLLHPTVEGMDIPVLQYQAQNLESLHEYIEAALAMPPEVRMESVCSIAERIRAKDIWSVRMREIFGSVDGAKK